MAQELGNSLADLRRQLGAAGEERATLLAVQRQTAADLARAQSDADAARGEAAGSGRALAQANTQLKVAYNPPSCVWPDGMLEAWRRHTERMRGGRTLAPVALQAQGDVRDHQPTASSS